MKSGRFMIACAALLAGIPFCASAQSTPDSALGPLTPNRLRDEASGTTTTLGERQYYYFQIPVGSPSSLSLVLALHQGGGASTAPPLTFRLLKYAPPTTLMAGRWVAVNTDFLPVPPEASIIQWRDIHTSNLNKVLDQKISYRYYNHLGVGTFAIEVAAPSSGPTRRQYSVGLDFNNPLVVVWRLVFDNQAGFSVTAPVPVECVGIDQPCI